MASLSELIKSKAIYVPDEIKLYQDIFRHFRGKQVGDPPVDGDSRPLLGSAEHFYCEPPTNEGFLQGDILDSIAPVWIDSSGEATVGEVAFFMVLSNECDTELRSSGSQKYIRGCPVYTEEFVLKASQLTGEKLSSLKGNLRSNKMSEYFWMPEYDGKNALVADLGHIFSVDLEWFHKATNDDKKVKRIISLSKDAYYLLQIKIGWFLLRPVPDSRRQ